MDTSETIKAALELLASAELQVRVAKQALEHLQTSLGEVLGDKEALIEERKRLEKEREEFQKQRQFVDQVNAKTDDNVCLNVGGKRFETSRKTLCAVEGSMLAACFDGRHPTKHNETGAVVFDRDPQWFSYLLTYLRNGCKAMPFLPDPITIQHVREEFAFFGIPWPEENLGVPLVERFASGWQDVIVEGHTAQVSCVAASSSHVASGGEDNTVRVWDIATGQPIRIFECNDEISSVSIYGNYVAAGDRSGNVKVWDLESKTQVRAFTEDDSIDYVRLLDGLILIEYTEGEGGRFGQQNACIKVYDTESGEQLWEKKNINSLSQFAEMSGCLVGGVGKEIVMWMLEDGEEVSKFTGHTMEIVGIASYDGGVVSFGLSEDDLEGQDDDEGDKFPIAGDDGEVLMWDKGGQILKRIHLFDSQALARFAIGCMSVVLIENPEEGGCGEGGVLVVKGYDGQDDVRLKGHVYGVSDVAVVGEVVISSGDDMTVRVWRPTANTKRQRLQ